MRINKMKITIKKRTAAIALQVVLAVLALSIFFIGPAFNSNFAAAANITNNTVIARVNITNTEPSITSVIIDDDSNNPASQIDLTPLATKRVYCNATVFDYNGVDDINGSASNATLYISSVGKDAAADNNHLYFNSSCAPCTTVTSTSARCECGFNVQYYANDSSQWVCHVNIRDNGGTAGPNSIYLNDSAVSSAVTINKLLAINTTSLIDYGNLSVTQTSAERVHNVTNGGNVNLNLSLRGFGGTNDSLDHPGNNLTMICDFGNITVGYQRYALGTESEGMSYDSMQVLQNQTRILNLTVQSRINDTTYGADRNSTFWRLQVPLTVGGICNGTIIFGAVEAQ